ATPAAPAVLLRSPEAQPSLNACLALPDARRQNHEEQEETECQGTEADRPSQEHPPAAARDASERWKFSSSIGPRIKAKINGAGSPLILIGRCPKSPNAA